MHATRKFNERLRAAIIEHGLSEQRVAELAGMDMRWLNTLLNGDRQPRLTTLGDLLAALPETDARWLITGTPQKQKEELLPLPYDDLL